MDVASLMKAIAAAVLLLAFLLLWVLSPRFRIRRLVVLLGGACGGVFLLFLYIVIRYLSRSLSGLFVGVLALTVISMFITVLLHSGTGGFGLVKNTRRSRAEPQRAPVQPSPLQAAQGQEALLMGSVSAYPSRSAGGADPLEKPTAGDVTMPVGADGPQPSVARLDESRPPQSVEFPDEPSVAVLRGTLFGTDGQVEEGDLPDGDVSQSFADLPQEVVAQQDERFEEGDSADVVSLLPSFDLVESEQPEHRELSAAPQEGVEDSSALPDDSESSDLPAVVALDAVELSEPEEPKAPEIPEPVDQPDALDKPKAFAQSEAVALSKPEAVELPVAADRPFVPEESTVTADTTVAEAVAEPELPTSEEAEEARVPAMTQEAEDQPFASDEPAITVDTVVAEEAVEAVATQETDTPLMETPVQTDEEIPVEPHRDAEQSDQVAVPAIESETANLQDTQLNEPIVPQQQPPEYGEEFAFIVTEETPNAELHASVFEDEQTKEPAPQPADDDTEPEEQPELPPQEDDMSTDRYGEGEPRDEQPQVEKSQQEQTQAEERRHRLRGIAEDWKRKLEAKDRCKANGSATPPVEPTDGAEHLDAPQPTIQPLHVPEFPEEEPSQREEHLRRAEEELLNARRRMEAEEAQAATEHQSAQVEQQRAQREQERIARLRREQEERQQAEQRARDEAERAEQRRLEVQAAEAARLHEEQERQAEQQRLMEEQRFREETERLRAARLEELGLEREAQERAEQQRIAEQEALQQAELVAQRQARELKRMREDALEYIDVAQKLMQDGQRLQALAWLKKAAELPTGDDIGLRAELLTVENLTELGLKTEALKHLTGLKGKPIDDDGRKQLEALTLRLLQ